ncbi:MAG: glucose 1-dehydrogenase [Alphaproteobacteria bacterium]|nr:glucose 1-dehydrogenase [Alphaproteobacteria bacterium]
MAGGKLEGKVAIVTGAGGGIGRAISARLAGEGAAVVAADLNGANAEATAQRITQDGGRAIGCVCDVSKSGDARATVELAKQRFGALHVLVNNAAVWIPDGTVADIAEDDWNRTFSVNLNGAFLMSKYAVPAMAASGGGSIIHIASQLGSVGKAGRTWYCAAKGALIQLAKAMAIDHAGQNIRVNSLSPGPIGTDRIMRRYADVGGAQKALGDDTILKRLGQPEEIAAAALFLASAESSFVTGSDLLVDGGFTAI